MNKIFKGYYVDTGNDVETEGLFTIKRKGDVYKTTTSELYVVDPNGKVLPDMYFINTKNLNGVIKADALLAETIAREKRTYCQPIVLTTDKMLARNFLIGLLPTSLLFEYRMKGSPDVFDVEVECSPSVMVLDYPDFQGMSVGNLMELGGKPILDGDKIARARIL